MIPAALSAITGVWPVAGGEIRLSGAKIDQYDEADLSRYIGYLPQRVGLFNGTVAENIARLLEVTYRMSLQMHGSTNAGQPGTNDQHVKIGHSHHGALPLRLRKAASAGLQLDGSARTFHAISPLASERHDRAQFSDGDHDFAAP